MTLTYIPLYTSNFKMNESKLCSIHHDQLFFLPQFAEVVKEVELCDNFDNFTFFNKYFF
jgi:hypothetical protein